MISVSVTTRCNPAPSSLTTKRNMRSRKSWTPGSGGVSYGTWSNSLAGHTQITCGFPILSEYDPAYQTLHLLQCISKASPKHLQSISEALPCTLMHCVSDSACYATPHHPLHPCLLSQTAPGSVTHHTRHASVTHFRPISGNIVEVTLVTSPKHVYNSHTKETYFP